MDNPIKITANRDTKTIFAEPNSGNVFDATAGDTITISCATADFQVLLIELSGSGGGASIQHGNGSPGMPFTATLSHGKFFKYIVRVGNLVLDPYIIITKP
jgi:hypothetical protein